MKRFDFPLERVLRWRREQASLEEIKLQQLRSEVANIQATRRQIESERAQSESHVLTQRSIDPISLESLDSYRQYVAGKIRQLEYRKLQWQAKIAEQLNRVIAARRQFELLGRLKQKALDGWQDSMNKEQEQLAAELFLAKSRRKN